MTFRKFVFRVGVLGVLSAGILGGVSLAASAKSDHRTQQIAELLKRFAKDPKAAMNAQPPRFDSSGNPVTVHRSLFSSQQIQSRDFLELKNNWRERHSPSNPRGSAEEDASPAQNDRAEDVVIHPESMVYRLEEMEKLGLTEGKALKQPWSGDYWAFYKGTLAARYADPEFPQDKDWKVNQDYVSAPGRSRGEIFAAGKLDAINQLSPAEKYDLLVDVANPNRGGLTSRMWNQGRSYYESEGTVADWMGICDGWAPAAFMLSRPTHAVTVLAADDETPITFYPHDIKALASQLWASGSYDYHAQIGSRCDDKKPPMDQNGRIRSEECFDVNPATVHLTLTHQLGAQRASLVMDASFDYEVWNQPLSGYRYSYFNPKTLKPVATLAEATVLREDFESDKFAKYRSDDSVAVVGIAMDLSYINEDEHPKAMLDDDQSRDLVATARYLYDVELDKSGQIIGGEWYTNLHPDFFWRPDSEARAISVGDSVAKGGWDGKSALPTSWIKGANRAASEGQPLATLVEKLIELSNLQPVPLPSPAPSQLPLPAPSATPEPLPSPSAAPV
jgi:hypothetical protein